MAEIELSLYLTYFRTPYEYSYLSDFLNVNFVSLSSSRTFQIQVISPSLNNGELAESSGSPAPKEEEMTHVIGMDHAKWKDAWWHCYTL